MNTYFKFISIIILALSIISCSSDDDALVPDIPEGDYFDGTLILNEGSSAGGSVSFLSSDLQNLTNSIFENENEGEQPGLYLQSIFFDDDRAFIISNGSNLISVVNRFTFELIGIINSGLSVPRYGTVLNGKAYVTNLDGFNSVEDDYVAVIDLETLEVEESVIVGAVAENIVNSNGQIYIQNAAFGSGNRVSRFDPATNSIIETLQVGDGLNSLEAFENKLYTLDSEGVKVINPGSFTIGREINRPEALASANNLRLDDGFIYYTSGTAAYASMISDSELSSEILFDYGSSSDFGAFYGFGVNDGRVYVGDAGDFASNGTVFVFSISGDLLADFSVGIAPNSFYFQ